MIPFLIVIVLAILLVSTCVKIVPQAHACVIERLGVYKQTWSVGIHFKVPFLEDVYKRQNINKKVITFVYVIMIKENREKRVFSL